MNISITAEHYHTFGSSFWRDVWVVYWSLNRQQELKRLLQWARHKQLAKPYRAYRLRMQDEQVRQAQYSLIAPHTTKLARIIHFLTTPVRANPHYPRTGSAAFYRSRRLDKIQNRLIVLDNNQKINSFN